MKFILTKKDIIALNQIFDSGNLINEASLDVAVSYARRTENWTKALAFLIRAILLDQVFEEGNKRTAALLIKVCAEFEGFRTNDDRIAMMIKKMLAGNIVDIIRIEEMIKDGIYK